MAARYPCVCVCERERESSRGLMLEERAAGAPTPRIDVGAYVKVGTLGARAGVGGERFWCVVTDVRADGELSARVDNDLVLSAYRCGDTIALHERHVLETASVHDCLTFRSLVAVHGLANGAAV